VLLAFRGGIRLRVGRQLLLERLEQRLVALSGASGVFLLSIKRAQRLVDDDVRNDLVLCVDLLGPVLLPFRSGIGVLCRLLRCRCQRTVVGWRWRFGLSADGSLLFGYEPDCTEYNPSF
jgi:hypothetical protein